MKKIGIVIVLLSVLLFSQNRELIPYSKTAFKVIDKNGNNKNVNMRGKSFIFISVREEESDGRFYAVDQDGTIWLSGGISSGEEVEFTPSGIWKVEYKKRFYSSKKYPEADGSNNMDYSLFFTNWGHAIHKGSINNTSHGCIHVEENDIRRLFAWANTGVAVLVSRHKYIQFARSDLKRIYVTEKKYTRSSKKYTHSEKKYTRSAKR